MQVFAFCADDRRGDERERKEQTTLQSSLPRGPKPARIMEAGCIPTTASEPHRLIITQRLPEFN